MAKLSLIERENKRAKCVEKYAAKPAATDSGKLRPKPQRAAAKRANESGSLSMEISFVSRNPSSPRRQDNSRFRTKP